MDTKDFYEGMDNEAFYLLKHLKEKRVRVEIDKDGNLNIVSTNILPKEITALHRLREDVTVLLRDDPEQFKVKHLHTGPGTELKKLLEKFGIHSKANCSCNKRAQYMDYAGNDWVEENMDTVVSWLEEEAKKRKLPFFKAAGKILVKKAIANSKKKQALE